ncbi:hypothetical protein C7D72_30010, partial [Klebsiella pneumoniae]
PDLEEINWLRDEYVVISQANRTALTLDRLPCGPSSGGDPDLEEINWLRDEYVVISQANRTALTLDRLPCGP